VADARKKASKEAEEKIAQAKKEAVANMTAMVAGAKEEARKEAKQ
jgi:hypothetical protein